MLPKELIDKELTASLLSENNSRLVLTLRGPKEGAEPFKLVEKARKEVEKL